MQLLITTKYQLWIGVFMGLLTGFAQYLRFREVNFSVLRKKFWTHIGISVGLSAILTFVASLELNIISWQYGVLAFAGVYAFVANLDYLISFLKGKPKNWVFLHFTFRLWPHACWHPILWSEQAIHLNE